MHAHGWGQGQGDLRLVEIPGLLLMQSFTAEIAENAEGYVFFILSTRAGRIRAWAMADLRLPDRMDR
jgi:hypothetical protein